MPGSMLISKPFLREKLWHCSMSTSALKNLPVTVWHLTLFRNLRFTQYGDKNLQGFWEAWREMVRRLGTLVGLKALAECLFREIAESRLMHDELKDFKK